MKLFSINNRILSLQSARIVSHPVRCIYFKDKDLDKKNYKPSEFDELDNYIRRYMQEDPKNLSEEEKNKLMAEYEKHKEAQKKAKQESSIEESTKTLNVNQPVEASSNTQTDSKFINPRALKDIFDKMVEIDSNPQSKRAQEYYQKLEEFERQNPKKRQSQIIIKTMKRGRTVKQETVTDFIGKQLTEEEKFLHRKFIDTKSVQWPEVNPIEMVVQGQGRQLKLANYRFPSLIKDRKGIIYFVNGYGDYCQRYAFFAQKFAEAGFDFVCMDPRGFGHSDGKRAYIESEEYFLEDQLKFIDLANEKFGTKDTANLGIGVSMGGIATLKISLAKPNFYKGMGLIAPYMALAQQQDVDKMMGLARFINRFYPGFQAPMPQKQRKLLFANKWLATINSDPLIESKSIPIRNLIVNEQMIHKFREKEQEKICTPFIMILGGKDQIVENKAAKHFFDVADVQDKDILTYDDADHFLLLDNEHMPLISKDLIGWFNYHV